MIVSIYTTPEHLAVYSQAPKLFEDDILLSSYDPLVTVTTEIPTSTSADVLFIEDDLLNCMEAIKAFRDLEGIKSFAICTKTQAAKDFIHTDFQRFPGFVFFDFDLDEKPNGDYDAAEMTRAVELYNIVWQKASIFNSFIIGLSRFENSGHYAELEQHMHKNGDFTFSKNAILRDRETFSNIVRNYYKINKLKVRVQKLNKANQRLEKEKAQLLKNMPSSSGKDYLIGEAPLMRKLYSELEMLKRVDKLNVFIHGERGTGKELIAKSIQEDGPRDEQSFAEVNCGAIPDENMAISTLFGHEKDAFNNAPFKKGVFELNNNGTVFLDEVTFLPPRAQDALMRVLTTGKFYRLGGHELVKTNVRIISAANNLEKAIESEKFREDLYDRLKEFEISLPPLRERKEDIPRLVAYFLNDSKTKKEIFRNDKIKFKLTNEVIPLLMSQKFPGNVRDLFSLLKTAMIKAVERDDEGFNVINGNCLGLDISQTSGKHIEWLDRIEDGLRRYRENGGDLKDFQISKEKHFVHIHNTKGKPYTNYNAISEAVKTHTNDIKICVLNPELSVRWPVFSEAVKEHQLFAQTLKI